MGGLDGFGKVGIWLSRAPFGPGELAAVATAVEDLGFGALWLGGGAEPGVYDAVAEALDATRRIPVATGISNIWVETPRASTQAYHHFEESHPGRFWLGIGVSHAPLVRSRSLGEYAKPLRKTREYLDALDAEDRPVPVERRLIGALGPKMLRVAADRTLGSHPYLVTPENTEAAHGVLGGAALAPELGVVVDDDHARGRNAARRFLEHYLDLPNYTNNWKRSGFTDTDLADGGSDRLVDALFAVGGADAALDRVRAHLDAGADHVCLQVVGPASADPVAAFTALQRVPAAV